jgi:hypothetical protein
MKRKDSGKSLMVRGLVTALLFSHAGPVWSSEPKTPASNPEISEDERRLRALTRQAEQAYERGELEKARDLWLQAWAVRKSHDIAALLGQVELDLKHYPEAATYLNYSLHRFAPSEAETTLATVQQAWLEAKKHVAAVRIRANREGADVFVDGRTIGKTPLQDDVFLSPGAHRFEARSGGRRSELVRSVEAGRELSVDLDVPADSSAHTAADSSASPGLLPGIIGGSVVLIGVAAAVGFKLAASSKESDADRVKTELGGESACIRFNRAKCSELYDANESVGDYHKLSAVSLAIAGAGAAATATYYLWPRASSGSGIRASASATPTGGARLWLSGSF